jgi:hypothetical protein
MKIERDEAQKLGLDPEKLVRGAILGSVEIADCVKNSNSKWAIRGQWHWILRSPRRFAKPMPCKGKLGFFRPKVRGISRLTI